MNCPLPMCRMPVFKYLLSLACLFIIASCGTAGVHTAQVAEAGANYIVNCTILDASGKVVRAVTGFMCVFFDDGRVLSAVQTGKTDDSPEKTLKFFSSDMALIWAKQIDLHHQMNLVDDEKNVLIGTSSVHEISGKLVRFDRLIKLDLNGHEMAAFDFFDHQDQLKKLRVAFGVLHANKRWRITIPSRRVDGANEEFSHLNSFYEIPENPTSKAIKAFQKGNVIVHANELAMTLILDHELKNILWARLDAGAINRDVSVHDVTVGTDGKILIYNNRSAQSDYKFGAIEEIDPVTSNVRTIYHGTPPSSFAPGWSGGVQRLKSGYLISDITGYGHAFEIDFNGVKTKTIESPFKEQNGKPTDIQQMTKRDLSEFQRNNKGL